MIFKEYSLVVEQWSSKSYVWVRFLLLLLFNFKFFSNNLNFKNKLKLIKYSNKINILKIKKSYKKYKQTISLNFNKSTPPCIVNNDKNLFLSQIKFLLLFDLNFYPKISYFYSKMNQFNNFFFFYSNNLFFKKSQFNFLTQSLKYLKTYNKNNTFFNENRFFSFYNSKNKYKTTPHFNINNNFEFFKKKSKITNNLNFFFLSRFFFKNFLINKLNVSIFKTIKSD